MRIAAVIPRGLNLCQEPDGRQIGIRGQPVLNRGLEAIQFRRHRGARPIAHPDRVQVAIGMELPPRKRHPVWWYLMPVLVT